MAPLLARNTLWTWLLLVGVTLATFGLAEHRSLTATWTIALVMLFAVIKARLIVLNYMAMRQAPRAWRIAFEVWLFGVPALILVLWLVSDRLSCTSA